MDMNLNTATKSDVIAYANDLGVEVAEGDTRQVIVDKIRTVLGEPAPQKISPELQSKPAEKPGVKMVKIRIAKSDKDSKYPVFVGVNGVGYAIKRGEAVEVPEPVVEALRNAVQVSYAEDGTSNESLVYPFEVLS
jgi:hypothetical protein